MPPRRRRWWSSPQPPAHGRRLVGHIACSLRGRSSCHIERILANAWKVLKGFLEAKSEPHPGAAAGREHDGAPHDPLGLLVDGAELALAQQHVQHGDQLSHRKARAQAAFDTAPERNPGIRLRSGAEEALGAELVWTLVNVGAAVNRDDMNDDPRAGIDAVATDRKWLRGNTSRERRGWPYPQRLMDHRRREGFLAAHRFRLDAPQCIGM